ncbi:MAG: LysR family transcriptional regulator [Ideonella sp.]|nr:LysR family transcriptional regulator [Ideonella sp.]
MPPPVNLRRIEAFLAVADAGSISRAASHLAVAQSVVSRHVGALEAELGTRLFARTGRGVVLTDAAQELAPRLRAALEDMARATQAAADRGDQPSGVVRVGLVPAATRPLVGLLHRRVRERYPRIRLQFVDGFSNALEERLVQGELDLAVINRFDLAAHRGEERLCVLASQVVGPAGAFGPEPAEIGFRQLAELPLVVASRPNGLRVALDQLCRQAEVQLNIVVEADSLLTMKDLVLQAGLHTVLPHHVVHEDVQAGRMSVARLVRPGLPRVLSLLVTGSHVATAAMRTVAHELRDVVQRELVPAVWK